ncbi:MAG: glycosyltransferase family 39 protein [Acidobacteriota bacterium]
MTRAQTDRWLLLCAFALFFCNAWGYDLWAPDEPYFGEGAREMVADGQWLVPHVNGVITTDKPPLFFWLIALMSAPFGAVSPLLARLPSILAGVGSVALAIRLGRRLGGDRTALLAGVVMATAYLPWDKARSAQIDALLMFLVLAAMSCFEAHRARSNSGRSDGRALGIAFWTFAGLATLAKGPVGVLLPVGAALLTLVFDRDLRAWRRFAPLLGPLAFAIVVGAWAIPAELWGGEYSLFGALETHFVNRSLHGMHHPNPPWYYLQTIPVQFLPWSGLLPAAFVVAWRRRDAGSRLLVAWVLFVVLLFTLSGERRDLYVLPAFPALALLVARAFDAPEISRRWITVPLAITGVLLLMLGVAAPLIARQHVPGGMTAIVVFSAAAFAAGLALLSTIRRGDPTRAALVAGGGMAAIYLVISIAVMPTFDGVKSARGFANEISAATADARAAGERVLAYRLGNLPEAISFYSAVYTVETSDRARLAAHVADGNRWLVADASRLKEIAPEIRARMTPTARATLSRMDVVLYRVD